MTSSAIYDIRLRIGYDFDHPAAAYRTILRMLPATRPNQQLITGLVDTSPAPDFRRDGIDFFGNPVAELAFDRPLARIGFRFTGRVRVEAARPALDLSPGLDGLRQEIAASHSLHPDAPHHFLGPSPHVALDRELGEFGRGVLAGTQVSARQSAMAICNALHAEFEFDPGATDVTTTPLEAFHKRRGVCQDISHVAISVLRQQGIPAGYVSGFLRTLPPPGQPRLEGADAMHAWIRVWCGAETGWVEIDPTNAMLAGSDHIVAAIGRDYSDVAPVKGALRSVGKHRTSHQVDVVPVQPEG